MVGKIDFEAFSKGYFGKGIFSELLETIDQRMSGVVSSLGGALGGWLGGETQTLVASSGPSLDVESNAPERGNAPGTPGSTMVEGTATTYYPMNRAQSVDHHGTNLAEALGSEEKVKALDVHSIIPENVRQICMNSMTDLPTFALTSPYIDNPPAVGIGQGMERGAGGISMTG